MLLAVGGMVKFGFELVRRFVSQCGVEALGVVDPFDERADVELR